MLMSLMMISWTLSLMFMFIKHPLSLGGVILLQTIIISISSGMLNLNYWFSYILFLVMIGGMLILFIYMTSVASNEKFKLSNNLTIMSMLSLMMIFFMLLFMDNYFPMFNMMNFDLTNQSFIIYNSIHKFMNFPCLISMLMMMIYLFLTLIATVKITKSKMGPLRQINI